MHLWSLLPFIAFALLFVRDLAFWLNLRKWPTYQSLSKSPIGGWPITLPEKERIKPDRERVEWFIQKYDTDRTMFRMINHNFWTSLVALIISIFIALLDFLFP